MGKPILFGKYYLLERINVGGMAEVFKAKATGVEGFERLVAVKRILPNIAEDEEFIGMFIDEAKIAVQLTHANIAQIFDLGKVGESYFIALEFVHGKDLRAIFNRARQRGEPVPMAMACYTIMKLCEALDYAHNKKDSSGNPLNFVHRDVSPQNVLISYEGEVKVIDFGIAKAAGKASKTRAGILKGKFGYMSPEQVQGLEIDKRSDVFGVGICLYELLTGERLFTGESDFSTVEKVRKVDIMPPSTYNRRIPEELEQVVLKALAREPSDRYQTALELHDDLQSFTYTSGNTFSRKDLSAYMRKMFAEEIEQESASDREYAQMRLPEPGEDLGAGKAGLPAAEASPAVEPPPRAKTPSIPPPLPPPRRRHSTLMGLPTPGAKAQTPQSNPNVYPAGGSKPIVPPLVPGRQSIPPRYVPPATSRAGAIAMDWDDEDLSTQIYDRPESTPPKAAAPLPPVPQIQYPTAAKAPVRAAEHTPTPAAASRVVSGSMPRDRYKRPPRLDERADLARGQAKISIPKRGLKRQQVLQVAAAAAAIIVAVLAVKFTIYGEPRPGIVHLSTIPKDALVKFDNKPITGTSSPFVIMNVRPGMSHLLEVSKEGYETWATDVRVEPDQIKKFPEVALRPSESGFTLDSVPSGAKVFVDGRELAQRTPVRVTALYPGPHQVRVEQEGYAPFETQINVTAGVVLELPAAPLVSKTAAAGARPAAAPRVASPEERPPRTAPASKPEAIRSPFRAPLAPRSRPTVLLARGTLRINTRPWSQVFVDGRLIGNTPQMAIPLEPGPHQVTLVNAQFRIQKSLSINIPPGETVTKIITLIQGM